MRYLKVIIFNILAIFLILALYEGLMVLLIRNPSFLARMPRKMQNSMGYLYAVGERRVIQFTPDCARYDRELGYTLRPGDCTFSGIEFTNRYFVNSLGLRDDEPSLDHPGIIVVGDSVAMGWGVDQEETFAQLLEKKSGQVVLNAGVSSYGTAREMLALRRAPTDRLHTLIIQYSGNDYEENRVFYLHGNVLPAMDEAVYNRWVDINNRMKDYYFSKYLRLKVEKKWAEFRRAGQEETTKNPDKDEVDLFLNALLESGIDLRRIRIVAFIVNGRNPGDNEGFTGALKKKIAAPSYPPFIRNMIVLDTAAILRVDNFYVLDDHPNLSGHEALAAALLKVIGKQQSAR